MKVLNICFNRVMIYFIVNGLFCFFSKFKNVGQLIKTKFMNYVEIKKYVGIK